jgi:hypothetical protein
MEDAPASGYADTSLELMPTVMSHVSLHLAGNLATLGCSLHIAVFTPLPVAVPGHPRPLSARILTSQAAT